MSSKTVRRRRVPGRRKGDQIALTTADLVILSLLGERPMHGYELLQEYERQQVEDWATISRPHVYYALQKLAGAGFIAGTAARDGDRERVIYRVEKSGHAALTNALASPEWATGSLPSPFTTWVGLSIHARPGDKGRVIGARQAFLIGALKRERKTLRSIQTDQGARVGIAEAMVTLAIAQYEIELKWLEKWMLTPRELS